jgi:sigma54-dependent transcription regulator
VGTLSRSASAPQHTSRSHTAATQQEITQRFPACRVIAHELPAADPKDFSILLGSLTRVIRDIRADRRMDVAGEIFVCVSSGTVEMRASWFLLNALGILPATLLQVGFAKRTQRGSIRPLTSVGILSGNSASERLMELSRGQAINSINTKSVPEAGNPCRMDLHSCALISVE